MARKKKANGKELIANKLRGAVSTQQPANKTENLTGRTLIANKLQSATRKAEEERSSRMRQGLSSVVRASFNNQRNLQPTTVQKGLYSNLRNQLAPVKHNSDYTRSQQTKFLNTDLQRKGLNTPMSQLMAGKTNVGVEQGKALRAGMPSGYITESWRTKPVFTPKNWRMQQRENFFGSPVTKENAFDIRADVNKIDRSHSQAELDARQKYGYSKDFENYMQNRVKNSGKIDRFDPSNGQITTPLPAYMNPIMQNQSTTYKAGKALADRMRWSDVKAGALDSVSAQEVEDVAKNAYGFTPDDELQSKIESQRGTLGYGTGMAAGQMAQYALTRGALTGLGAVGKGAKATETAAQAFRREMAIDQAASLPLNIIDAMKEDNLDGMIKRFGMNQGLDLAFGILTEVPSLAKNKLFKSAQAKNIAAQEAEQAGDTVTANAMRQSAKRDLDSIPTEELNKAQEEIRNAGYHAGDLGKAENYFQQASGYRHTGHYGTGTYFGGSEDMFSGSSGYGNRPEWKFDFDGYNLYKPKNYEQGIRVHDSLATIDRRSANGLLNDLQLSKDAETIRRVLDDYEYSNPKERLDELKDIAEKYLSKNDIDRIEDDALSAYNYESARINDENYLENRKSEMKSLSEMLFPEDEIDDAMVLDLIASEETPTLPTLDEFRLNYYSDELRKQLDGDVPFGRTSLAEHIENAQNTVKQLAQDLGKTEDEVLNAIEKAARKVEKEYPSVSQSSGMKDLDSEATLVMKNLGFEGVDVRGIDGLDNTEYGSVIYDLKPESRRQQIKEGQQTVEKQPTNVGDASEQGRPEENQTGVGEEPIDTVEPNASGAGEKNQEINTSQKQKAKQDDEPAKDGLGRDIFEGQPRYKPSGAGRDEKFWSKVTKKYEKKSTAWLNAEKLSLPSKVTKNKMGESEMIERSKLIDSLIDEKARYRHGTLKEVDGTKVSQAYDTLSHSDKTKRIRDELQRTFIDEGTGRKQGMNPKQAAEDAVARVENDPDAIKLKLLESNDTALKGKFPAKYDNSQEYYADALAYLNHNDSLMEQLEEQGLKNTSQYELLKSDAVKITNGVMAYRSSEGYGAIQYNMLCRSSGEMRVAVVQKAVDDINQQFEKQLEKAAKKEGKKLTEKDKIRIKLTDDAIKKLKGVNPDSPLEMSKAMHEISEDIWNQVPAAFKEETDAIRMTSMLLNPKTHIRNFIGNAFMIPARIMKDILGAPLEKAATKIKFRGESVLNPEDATKAVVNRFSKKDKPYFDAAKQVWEEWKDYVRGDMKYFDTVTPTASRLLGSRPVGSGRVFTAGRENPAAWRRVADAIINFNGRLLESSDALFLKYHFTDSFAQVCKARNLDPTKLTSQELQEVISAATGEAQRATFRDVSEAAKLINGLKASKPDDALIKKGVAWATSTTMPFVNTPINILRRSWDYSPAGLIHGCAEIVQGVGKGNSKEVKKGIDRMCSGLTGSGICIVGFLLGRDGGLTAKLSEGSEGYYEQDQGFQEYSINLEGKDGIDVPFLELENEDGVSVSLSSFAPLVIPLFTGVEVANWWGDDKEVDWSAVGRAADTIGRIFDPTMDMSVMQGPMGVLKAIQDADDLKTAPIDVGLNIAINHYMQYIPTAFGQAARITDPTRRDLSSTKSSYFDKQLEKAKLKFQSRIPSTPLTDNSLYNISSTGIQPYKDTWGREQKTLEGHPVKRFFYETVSPSYIREKNITELDEEITRLNKAATQEEKVIPTKFFGNEISFNGGKVGVDRKDITVYNEFRGKSAYAAASKLIGTDAYKTASDTEKRNMLNEVFKNANTEGKQNMLLSKGYSAKTVYTEGFEGGKKENADNVFNAGVAPKRYYELMTDKSVDLNGNGSKSQYEVYTYLQDTDLTDAQKAAIWNSYNKGWKNNPYAGGYIPTADGGKSGSNSGSSKRGRSGRRSGGGGSSKTKARAKTASEKKFAALQTGKAPTNAKGIEALSGASGLTKAQKKALVKLMQKKLDV